MKIYTASWCKSCKPYVAKAKMLIKDNTLEVIDVSNLSPDELERMHIRGVPVTIIEEDGEVIDRWVGNRISKLEEYLI